MNGLSFVGKSTLFSRVALSPQPADKGNRAAPVKNNSSKISGNQDNTTMMSTTINQSSLAQNTQQRMMKTSLGSFRDTVQRGVLSGIGLLKK